MSDTLETGIRRTQARSRSRLPAGLAVIGAVALAAVAAVAWRSGAGGSAIGAIAAMQPIDALAPAAAVGHAGSDHPRSQEVSVAQAPSASDQRALFDRSSDLYAYAQALEPAVRANQPDAIWLVSRVYDYCSSYSMSPAAYAGDTETIREMGMRGSSAMAAARDRVSRRCARFVPEDELTPRMILAKRVEAAKAGSLAAEASLMAAGQPLKQGEAYERDLVERVQRSRDPEAYSALSPGMGITSSGRLQLDDQVSGTQFAELAWQLAACRLGMDCGPDSALMTSYCANGGICSTDATQDFTSFVYDAAVPRQGAAVVNEMVDSLMSEKRAKR